MKTLNYEVEINASVSTIWNVLIGPDTYKKWVKAFSPNSYADGEWKQGAKIKFLDPDMGGTQAVLDIVEPKKRILARHIALISKEGEISTSGEMADKWLGTTEDYQLTSNGKTSKLTIEIRTHQDFIEMFNNAWPEAISTIKEMSENTSE